MIPLLDVAELQVKFPVARKIGFGPARPSFVHAVDDVSLTLQAGETVGLVGESGCGKSTLARTLCRLIDATSGSIQLEGRELSHVPIRRAAREPWRGDIQLVFQDALDAINPRMTAFQAIADPLKRLRGLKPGPELDRRVAEVAESCGVSAGLLGRFPHQLSGGQRARVGIARAIACRPKLLVLDEPTAALDVSVQVVILHLLAQLKRDLGMSYLFVSHDLNVVRMFCDRIVVMYLGKIVETGPAAELFANPRHPYTAALLAAIPSGIPGAAPPPVLEGEPKSPIDPSPTACRFAGRCPAEQPHCTTAAPPWVRVGHGHHALCHLVTGA
ncbi:MAG: ABC transporter ATP-binding protein [Alphaproteobacteria bacterium]|nr:ABC transporter ATP-binding protein [Alphaproteobacteria bacterium]TAD90461.1 MAG: ABC transporter ATP-binding protein [Alphaproteobacteria bacterium]